MRQRIFIVCSILLGAVFALIMLELGLRAMPVSDGLRAMPVNEADPVFHFTPNREVTWSRDWNFSFVNRVRINNAGYVNDQDYRSDDPRSLLAVVGDSYVEATIVRYRETLQGRLAEAVGPAARVYSFGASGAPLSQYLVWAREARERWKAQALAIVVVGNDFDESLATYGAKPGFHQYVAGEGGLLSLRRFDYRPGRLRFIVHNSALARYLIFNMQVQAHLQSLFRIVFGSNSAKADIYVGNTSAQSEVERIRLSQLAVDAFLRDLQSFAGWQPSQVVLVVDGLRYPSQDPSITSSYFARMRSYLLAEARRVGYEAIDMDKIFISRFNVMRERYEFPTDGHWNALAHGLAADAVTNSQTFINWRNGRFAVQ